MLSTGNEFGNDNMSYNWDYLDRKSYNNRTGHYKFRREFEFITNNGQNHFDKILDIAGGSGRFAIPLSNFSKNITVIDVNPTAIQILSERKQDINSICGEFIKTDIHDTFSDRKSTRLNSSHANI